MISLGALGQSHRVELSKKKTEITSLMSGKGCQTVSPFYKESYAQAIFTSCSSAVSLELM